MGNERQLFFNQNGESDEGDESYGRHEGHACYEEEGSEQDRQGQDGQGSRLPWQQGEDRRWHDQIRFDQEQVRQDREQEAIPLRQEEQLHQGLRCDQEGLRSLQEGQGTLPVSMHRHAKASAQGVGMSTPLERRRLGQYDVVTVSTID